MNSIDIIKNGIRMLYKTNPNIHVNVSLATPKLNLRNQSVLIKGVYPHVFQIEERGAEHLVCHTLQYVDVLTKNIEILELGQ